MTYAPIRRSQLVSPFGVGAMVTAPDGTSMICAALDNWFTGRDGISSDIDLDEFRFNEWRLQEALKVNEFRLPPDYRKRSVGGDEQRNLYLTVPFLRFPLWNFCPHCRTLIERAPHHGFKLRCPTCEYKAHETAKGGKVRKAPFVIQVSFIAICARGHVQDFPWREYVHRDVDPKCQLPMKLEATGGGSLAGQKVSCACGIKSRTLARVTEAFVRGGKDDTYLSANLAKGARFDCRGERPWMADRTGQGCGEPLRGNLRGATNVYFPHVESAIYLPGGAVSLPDGLIELLREPPLANSIHLARELGFAITGSQLLEKDKNRHLLNRFNASEIDRGLEVIANEQLNAIKESSEENIDPQSIRRPEYAVLGSALDSIDLRIREMTLESYESTLSKAFTKINLIDRLRETRVLFGFSRVKPDNSVTLPNRKKMLWKDEPGFANSWLPAYIVHGEGLFFELDQEKLRKWETRPDVVSRVQLLASHPDRVFVHQGLADTAMIPRFVMLHTFAHLLINQLVFECGYSSASLRERLFCSMGNDSMAGVLIYTAAGDSEGTMGGLVRMGRPGNLEPTMIAALDRARWCSSDPVCMELGEKGQGPSSMNLAACHSCALLPETACETFNRFLDRALVTGTQENPGLGLLSE